MSHCCSTNHYDNEVTKEVAADKLNVNNNNSSPYSSSIGDGSRLTERLVVVGIEEI